MPPRRPPLRLTAIADSALEARIVRRVAMRYADGADPTLDRPEHIRAASSVTWVGQRLAVVQDDANFLALVDPATGLAESITLPAGKDDARQFDDGRGNKKHKLDLEALAQIPTAGGTTLLAIASGSKKRRQSMLTLGFQGRTAPRPASDPMLVELNELYERLRAERAFAGSDMNIEGAVYLDGVLRLFSRGNGKADDDGDPVAATCDLDWPALLAHIERPEHAPPPPIARITQYALGTLGGIPLGFTDAVRRRGSGVLFSAAAEASPDASEDGDVGGSALGVLPADRRQPVRITPILDQDGTPFAGKVEGVVLDRRDPTRALVVVDVDDHTRPAELCEVVLRGAW